jgi:hypothetical protein
MQTTGNPNPASFRASQGDIGPLSSPTFSSAGRHLCNAAAIASGWVSTTPRQALLPAPSTTHTAVRLKPTSKPANIVIAALLPLQGINSEKARLFAGEQQPHVWDV